MKKHLITVIFVLVFAVGLGVLLYPTVSDYLNSLSQSRAIAYYSDELANVSTQDYESILESAYEYNKRLLHKKDRYRLSDEENEEYYSLLNVTSKGITGYLEIDVIGVKLPIYQGISEGILRVGLGHIQGTSLPVGGIGTHTAISGHRGLPSATLLTNLDRMVIGDVFVLNVLSEILVYEVDQILIVEPDDLSALDIDVNKDYATLVTCTPYGINTHRMLVRGHRIAAVENGETISIRVSADARAIDSKIVTPFVAMPILAGMVINMILKNKKQKRNLQLSAETKERS